jgi:DNA-binding Lrp family transcriptional regulator
MVHLDAIDKKILNRVQSNFPITRKPYQTIADDLDLTEQEVILRLVRLKKVGIIRRIGANFVPHKVGHVSTLCAAKVPEEKIAQFAEKVNRYRGVTHNYQRDGEYNIWFTFIAPSMAEIEANLRQITVETGITDIINLPATQVFKIKAQFDL